ncbi:tetratricopeptide repeat protein [Cryomorphaceae bacterium]|nr:tetratricopeptide repeat protein [Cryomorphaceae bacterium]
MKRLASQMKFWLLAIGFLVLSGPTGRCATSEEDSIRVLGYIQQAYRMSRTNLDSAFLAIDEALDSVRAIENEPLLIRGINVKGILYDIAGQDSAAMAVYEEAFALADSAGDLKMQASIGNNIGLIHWNRGHYDEAVAAYEASLALFREIEYLPGQANNLNNISLIYAGEFRYEEAIQVLRQSYALRLELADGYGLSAALSNLGFYYAEINQIDSSLYYSRLALMAKDTVGDERGKATVYGNLGNAYQMREDVDSAIWAYRAAVDIDRALEDSVRLIQHLNPLAWQLHLKGQDAEAYRLMKECAAVAERKGAVSEQWEVYYRLGDLATEQGESEVAAPAYERAFNLYNTLRNEEREEQVIEFQERFQTAEAKIALAEEQEARTRAELEVQRRNNLLLLLAASLILGGIGAAAVWRRSRERQRRERAEQEVKEQLMKSGFEQQLTDQRQGISQDLHDNVGSQLSFLSSALQNLSFALQMRDQPGTEVAGRLEEMSAVAQESVDDLRNTVWAMNRDQLNSQELLTRLEQGVRRLPEGLGATRVEFAHEGEARILPQAVGLAIYRMTQEALNNALKYASAQHISVSIAIAEKISFRVSDDGSGFDPAAVARGSGLEGMQRRADRHGLSYALESEIGSGTTIEMSYHE